MSVHVGVECGQRWWRPRSWFPCSYPYDHWWRRKMPWYRPFPGGFAVGPIMAWRA